MKKRILILLSLIIFGLIAGLIFLRYFFSAFAPIKIQITKSEIISNRELINPISIQRIARIDSMGEETPIKYTIDYVTTCSIKQKLGKPPVGLHKIYFLEPGRYIWSEEAVNIPFEHIGLSRNRVDSINSIVWSSGEKKYEISPLKFENNKWYFFDFLEPSITGIFIYVNAAGKFKQYTKYSGVSPI